MTDVQTDTVVEAVAVFHDEAAMWRAIDALQTHGTDRAAISLMASEHAIEAKLGHRYERLEEIADDPRTPRQAPVAAEDRGAGEGMLIGGLGYIGAVVAGAAVVASGGTLGAAIAGVVAAGGGGAAIGGLLARWLSHHHAREIEDHLRHGGLLLWVRVDDQDTRWRRTVCSVLADHTDEPVRLHRISPYDPSLRKDTPIDAYDVGLPWLFRRKR